MAAPQKPRVSPIRDLNDVPPSQIAAVMAPFAGQKDEWNKLPDELMPNPRGENFIVTVGVSYILGALAARLCASCSPKLKCIHIPVCLFRFVSSLRFPPRQSSVVNTQAPLPAWPSASSRAPCTDARCPVCG
jgi:hypothetical protein